MEETELEGKLEHKNDTVVWIMWGGGVNKRWRNGSRGAPKDI